MLFFTVIEVFIRCKITHRLHMNFILRFLTHFLCKVLPRPVILIRDSRLLHNFRCQRFWRGVLVFFRHQRIFPLISIEWQLSSDASNLHIVPTRFKWNIFISGLFMSLVSKTLTKALAACVLPRRRRPFLERSNHWVQLLYLSFQFVNFFLRSFFLLDYLFIHRFIVCHGVFKFIVITLFSFYIFLNLF
jgi:hypothetical protein